MEMLVLEEAFCAMIDGYFSQKQLRFSPKKILSFCQHGGMWGDFFIISPIVAFIASNYYNEWSGKSIAICSLTSLIMGIYMQIGWTKNTIKVNDMFGQDGHISFNGYIHFVYTIISLSSFFLFYFATPHGLTKPHAWWVTIALGIHAAIGFLQPQYAVEKRIGISNIITVIIFWTMLAFGWWRITSGID